jgi:DNA repair exonuclease SbcCD ATPase subunit
MSQMLRVVPLLFPLLLFASPAAAQSDVDMRELRSYRLTMAAVRQVDAATVAMAAEMKKDPKYQEYLKLEAEISALEKKGGPTEAAQKLAADIEALESKGEWTDAEAARLEQLREQLDALEQKRPMRTDADDARLEQLRERSDALEEATGPGLDKAETLSEWEAAIRRHPAMARGLRAAGMSPRDYAKFMLSMLGAGMVAGLKMAGHIKETPKELADVVSPENVKFVEQHHAELAALQKKWEALGKTGR